MSVPTTILGSATLAPVDWGAVAKTAMPWFTGGLAGAILTNWMSSRWERRKTARLDIRISSTSHSAEQGGAFEDVKIQLDGRLFEELEAHEIVISNVSTRPTTAIWYCALPPGGVLVRQKWFTRPIRSEPKISSAGESSNGGPGAMYDFGELRPDDTIQGVVLVSKKGPIQWIWRGSPETSVNREGRIERRDFEADIRSAVLWLSAFFLSDALYFFGAPLKSALLILAMPWFLRNAERLRATFQTRTTTKIQLKDVEAGGNITISPE